MPQLEAPARKESKPLPNFPEPTPEEAALAFTENQRRPKETGPQLSQPPSLPNLLMTTLSSM